MNQGSGNRDKETERYSKQIYEVEKTKANNQINTSEIQERVTDDSKVSLVTDGGSIDQDIEPKEKKKEKIERKIEMMSCVLNMLNLRWL